MTLEEFNSMLPLEQRKLAVLNQKQTAEALGCSSSSLNNWANQGLGPSFKKIDSGKKGRILYPKTAIIEWLSNTVKTA
ncbi:terminase small subunit [Aliarcobacter butzleri]|uniref:helix-turn-helix domain-containing protein n=1 Tax=Aliarcobacter butzleri TaxID=28197 RepID=UPI001EDC30BE|nr:helix-turn-helix domain-containing protein [Aliarcobacter butzleri]MCG3678446.1 terminase small subunit [Aliarcobacter butzleri]MDN5095369.1 helix-turn-helix domain-containing protein [Aliarcobacter butzleri]